MKTDSPENLFCQFLGSSPEAKILDYLMNFRTQEFTFNDIVTTIHVNRQRAYEILRFLLDEGFIKEVDKIKNIQFYQLDIKRPEVKCLQQFFDKIVQN